MKLERLEDGSERVKQGIRAPFSPVVSEKGARRG